MVFEHGWFLNKRVTKINYEQLWLNLYIKVIKIRQKVRKQNKTSFIHYLFVLNLHSMRNLSVFIAAFISIGVFAQKDKNVLSQIDSISQSRWNSNVLDLDSLANPKFEKFEVRFKDIIIVNS